MIEETAALELRVVGVIEVRSLRLLIGCDDVKKEEILLPFMLLQEDVCFILKVVACSSSILFLA